MDYMVYLIINIVDLKLDICYNSSIFSKEFI